MAAPTVTTTTLVDSVDSVILLVTFPTAGTADVSQVVIADPATFTTGSTPVDFRIRQVDYSIFGCAVMLYNDATTPVLALSMNQTGTYDFTQMGNPRLPGLQSFAGTGATGKIKLSTAGIAAITGPTTACTGSMVITLSKMPALKQ